MTDKLMERGQNFEKQFELDGKKDFQLRAKAIEKFGLWVAKKLGMKEEEAENYSQSLLSLDINVHGTCDAECQAVNDLKEKGVDVTEHHIHNQFLSRLEEAKEELAK